MYVLAFIMSAKSKHLRVFATLFGVGLVIAMIFVGQKTRASSGVDVAILIALDVSASVDASEFDLMREGLAAAISSPEVTAAVVNGKRGAIAVSVVQWSGFTEQEMKLDWTRLSSTAELTDFANRIRKMSRRYSDGATDIGGALNFSRKKVLASPFQASRSVIDLAGDGPNNVNFSPRIERDLAIKDGITINGLAVIGEVSKLEEYFTRFIIGGPNAFVEKTADYDGFMRAMERKLIREIGSMFLF